MRFADFDMDSSDFRPTKKAPIKRKREVDFDKLRAKQFEKRRDRNRHSKQQELY